MLFFIRVGLTIAAIYLMQYFGVVFTTNSAWVFFGFLLATGFINGIEIGQAKEKVKLEIEEKIYSFLGEKNGKKFVDLLREKYKI